MKINRPTLKKVPYEPSIPVSTAWDLGVNDYTFIWFFQQYREEIRVINCYRLLPVTIFGGSMKINRPTLKEDTSNGQEIEKSRGKEKETPSVGEKSIRQVGSKEPRKSS